MTPIGWIGLFLLCILFFWLYRDYRLDLLRQNLFALRDELFDLADEDKLNFEHRAYGMLRSTINGTIQYGHNLGFIELMSMFIATRRLATEHPAKRYSQRFREACSELDEETQRAVTSIHARMHLLIAEHVIFTSFTLMVTLVTLFIAALLFVVKDAALARLQRLLARPRVEAVLSALDSAACLKAT